MRLLRKVNLFALARPERILLAGIPSVTRPTNRARSRSGTGIITALAGAWD